LGLRSEAIGSNMIVLSIKYLVVSICIFLFLSHYSGLTTHIYYSAAISNFCFSPSNSSWSILLATLSSV
jgi:hypothetical protein